MLNDETQGAAESETAAETLEAGSEEQSAGSTESTESETETEPKGLGTESEEKIADGAENAEKSEKTESAEKAKKEESEESAESDEEIEEKPEDEFAKDYLGKPENGYDYKELMPEGWELNKDLTEKFNDIAGKYNMSQKGASEAMALAVDLAKQTQEGVLSAQAQEIEAKRIKYSELVTKDPEIGGAKLDESLRVANLAYSKFIQGDKEAHDEFCKSGLNGHPAVVKMFYEVGKQMQDDVIHSGGASSSSSKSGSELLYSATTPSTKGGAVTTES